MRYLFYSILILSFLQITSCQDSVATPKTKVDVSIQRFDLDLKDAFEHHSFDEADSIMKKKYPDLFPFYIETLMGIGNVNNKNDVYYYGKYFPDFFKGEYMAIEDTIKRLITDKLPEQEKKLSTSYGLLLDNFKFKKPSKIFSFFISPMGNQPVAAFSYGTDTVGINLFNYLGTNFSLYPSVFQGFSYMIQWNSLDYLVRNVLLVEYNSIAEHFKLPESEGQLIHQMINRGKQYYYLDVVCPDLPDETKIGYSKEEMKWCVDNENEIWSYFKEHNLLYSTDHFDQKKYTEEGPNTSGMPKESPGMVGTWLGWQIVRQYAQNTNSTPEQVIKTSCQDILTKAKYKPKK